MRSIIKILTVLLLTLFVVVGGGYYFYTLVHPKASDGTFWYEFFLIGEPRQTMELVPNYYENLPSIKTNSRSKPYVPASNPSLLGSSESSGLGGLSSGLAESNLPKYNFNKRQGTSSTTYSNKGGYAYKIYTQEGRPYNSAGGVLSYNAYGSSGFRGSSGYAGNSSSGGGIATISSPLAVPFSNSYTGSPTTTSGTILFDPSAATTEEIEKNTIPIGEGLWIMLMMAGVYGLLRNKYIFSIKIHKT